MLNYSNFYFFKKILIIKLTFGLIKINLVIFFLSIYFAEVYIKVREISWVAFNLKVQRHF